MGEIVKLTSGRAKPGKKIPKPVECKECGDPIETARLQATAGDILRCTRCISCQRAWERRTERQLDAVRDFQSVQIIR
jgi:RNA polymerase-binding transcription factor DksA